MLAKLFSPNGAQYESPGYRMPAIKCECGQELHYGPALYCLFVVARVLGLLYYTSWRTLRWLEQ